MTDTTQSTNLPQPPDALSKALHALIYAAANEHSTENPFYEALTECQRFAAAQYNAGLERAAAIIKKEMDQQGEFWIPERAACAECLQPVLDAIRKEITP